MNFFGWLGRFCIGPLIYLIDIIYFLTQALSIWRPYRNAFNRAIYSALLGQLIFTGVDAVAIISFLAVVIGMGITSQLVYIIHAISGASDITNILARLVISELGPLVTGITLIGRSCSAVTVDLANTKVRGEIQPLEYMGINVDDFFVMPRIISMMVCQVALALYFSIIMFLCGVYFSAFMYNFSAQESMTELLNTVSVNVVITFMMKNFVFGLMIGTVACFHGLAVENSPNQVPQQMQKAVVRSLSFLFLLDGYFLLLTL